MLIKAKFFQIQPKFIVNKIVPTFASLSAVDTFVYIFFPKCASKMWVEFSFVYQIPSQALLFYK